MRAEPTRLPQGTCPPGAGQGPPCRTRRETKPGCITGSPASFPAIAYLRDVTVVSLATAMASRTPRAEFPCLPCDVIRCFPGNPASRAGSGRQVGEDLSPPTTFCCAQLFPTQKQSTGGRAVPVRWPVVALGGYDQAVGTGWQAPGLLFADPGKWPGSLGGALALALSPRTGADLWSPCPCCLH